ncbi:zinc ribbon domain-containing protein [Halomicroarcula sp. GCM10025709]|uniref:DUF7577 domain-containing protein n=1 Tax=Haloarcula TaxID=2237 RepID=UPI0024C3A7F3|nr:zinc ribbon domain-containing protein [Halomicroarcula sp. YJ-61-S]
MMGTEWLYGAIALLVGIHVLTMLYAYRSRDEVATAATQSEAEPDRPLEASDERVNCPQCGTTNDPSYRFCRTCVADLSKRPPRRQPTGGSHPH